MRRVVSSPTLPVDEGAGDDCKRVAVGSSSCSGELHLAPLRLPPTDEYSMWCLLVGVIKPPCPVPLLPPLDEDVASE